MTLLSNFLLNTFAAVVDLAAREPDVQGLHDSIDALSSKRNRADSISADSPTSNCTNAASASNSSSPSKRKASGRDFLSMFLPKTKPKADADIMSSNYKHKHNQNQMFSNSNDSDECFYDTNENEGDAIKNPDDILYPNGERKITLEKGDFLGWALKPTGHRKNKDGTIVKYRVCMGVFVCPVPSCGFISRPILPRSKSKKSRSSSSSSGQPRGKDTKCKTHNCMLVHVPCNTRITIRESPESECVQIESHGNHDHPKPHRIHVSKHGKKTIHDHLRRKPNATPISMRVGTQGVDPVWTKDIALLNFGRLRDAVRKERKANHGTVDIAAFDKDTNGSFITASSISSADGAIIMQTDIMRKVLKESDVTSETDTIEGFLRDDNLPNANVTVTSSYCSLLDKWYPTQMAILFGKSGEHYLKYFNTLFQKGYEYKNFDEFDDEFMGMVCDFSDAERDGFKKAVGASFNLSEGDFDVEKYYTMCTVHFDRSLSRVCRNNAVVALQLKDEFKSQVMALRAETDKESFWKRVAELKYDFPKCKKWIDWYLNPKRGKCFFPSLKEDDFVGGVEDTNAQESTGRTIQLAYEGKAPNIADVFIHLFRYAKMCDFEYSCKATGQPTDYSRPKSPPKRSRVNDGRAPDTNKTLFPNIKQAKSTGRKRGTANKVPSGSTIVPMDVCIPWSFNYKNPDGGAFHVTNTCAMDTVLMGLFLLRQHDQHLQLKIKAVTVLDNVLDMIQMKKFDEARFAWIAHSRKKDNMYLKEEDISSSTCDDGTQVTRWNCLSSPGNQFGDAMKKLFLIQFYEDYLNCSGEGGEPRCGHYDEYNGLDCYAERNQKYQSIEICARDVRDIQGFLNEYYNEGGAGKEEDCGFGTKLVRNESGKYANCDGRRTYRRAILDGPTILIFERSIMNYARTGVDNMRGIHHLLKIGDQKYALVYCILSNLAHFQGIAIIYGKYLWYDGIAAVKMKWVNGDTSFEKRIQCAQSLVQKSRQ